MSEHNHKTWSCPFFTWESERAVHCEGGRLRFKDFTSEAAFTRRYCEGITGWQSCSVAKALLEYYDRK